MLARKSESPSIDNNNSRKQTTMIDYSKVVKITKQVLKEGGDDTTDRGSENVVDVWIIQPDSTRRGNNKVTCYNSVTLDKLTNLQEELMTVTSMV